MHAGRQAIGQARIIHFSRKRCSNKTRLSKFIAIFRSFIRTAAPFFQFGENHTRTESFDTTGSAQFNSSIYNWQRQSDKKRLREKKKSGSVETHCCSFECDQRHKMSLLPGHFFTCDCFPLFPLSTIFQTFSLYMWRYTFPSQHFFFFIYTGIVVIRGSSFEKSMPMHFTLIAETMMCTVLLLKSNILYFAKFKFDRFDILAMLNWLACKNVHNRQHCKFRWCLLIASVMSHELMTL